MVACSQKSGEGVGLGEEAEAIDEGMETEQNTPRGRLEGRGLLPEESGRGSSCCPERRPLKLISWSVGEELGEEKA